MFKKLCQFYKTYVPERELKWHTELNTTYNITFWNRAYKQVSEIKYDNNIKWMQYQIMRNSQFTNYRVSKFNTSVSPLCSFCNLEGEKISHLYFTCNEVQNFLVDTSNWLNELSVNIAMNIKTILFGIQNERTGSQGNIIILWIKKYIWTSRVKKTNLSLGTFQIVLLNNLKKLKELYDFLNKSQLFENWTSLFYNLNQDV